jgi:acetyltransferase-like isoleucine patch superfamily enzyme
MLHYILRSVQRSLQKEKRRQFGRRVSFGDLVTDRHTNAAEYHFGEGTTCYDNVLIIGDVKVGKACWIGPNVILDGIGGLEIGDHVCVSSGVHIYTHDSSRRFVSLGQEADLRAPTKIGTGVFIGPQAVVVMGVTIGDRVLIGSMAFVNKDVPSGCTAYGIPARIRRNQ